MANTCVQKPVTFNDLSTSASSTPVTKYIWTYGYGNSDTLTSGPFSYTYAKAGSYDVKLVIIDVVGCRDTLVKKASVIITDPRANYTITDLLNRTLKGSQVRQLIRWSWSEI